MQQNQRLGKDRKRPSKPSAIIEKMEIFNVTNTNFVEGCLNHTAIHDRYIRKHVHI